MTITQEALKYLAEEVGRVEHREGIWFGAGKCGTIPHPVAPRLAKPVEITTLSGFATFVATNIDALALGQCVAVVRAPNSVALYGRLDSARQRETTIVAEYTDPGYVAFLRQMPLGLAPFVAGLSQFFESTEDTVKLAKLLSDVKATGVRIQKLEGFGQRLEAERGVAGDGWQSVEYGETFSLAPYRMFPEAGPQIASPYIIRVESQGEGENAVPFAVLLPAGGEAWRAAAMAAVASKLHELFQGAAAAAGIKGDEMPAIVA